MSYKAITNFNKGLSPGDGMSAGTSTRQQRVDVLARLQGEVDLSVDCADYGFYIGRHWPGPIPDYTGDCVKREIKINLLK